MAFSKEEVVEEEVEERQRAGSGVLVLQGAPLLVTSLLPSPSRLGPTLEGGRVALAPVWINIISVINIKSALLCFASGSGPRQLEGPVLTDGRFLPSSPPHPCWPFTGTIIYFGEFLGYCFVRANQGWVTNDPGGVVVACPQPPLLPAL